MWMDLLSEFDFEIKNIKGKQNRVANSLSRSMKVVHLDTVSTSELDIKERVKSAQEMNAFFNIVTSYLKQEPTKMKYEVHQMFNDGLITCKGRLYILNCDKLKRFIMDEIHKRPYTGHTGYQKMITDTRRLFY
jgi:hypothetical protein